MERVVTINLNGNPYQLEEPAYDALRAYMDGAQRALADNPDKGEITRDLEQAIADKCAAYLGPAKTVVSAAEMARVLDEMGLVEGAGEQPPAGGAAPGEERFHPQRRLYRIYDRTAWTGVSAGLAAYADIDVAWVRVLWILSALFTGGFTILIYLALIFAVPVASTNEEIAAAHGAPFNAQEVVERAKREYARFTDESGPRWQAQMRAKQRHWNRQMREWRQSWDRFDFGAGPVAAPPQPVGYATRMFAGLMALVFSLVTAALLIAFLFALFSLLATGAVLGWSPLGDGPIWLAVVVLAIAYAAISAPFSVLRRSSYATASGYPHGGGGGLDGLVTLALVALAIWLAYLFVPDAREIIKQVPDALRDTVAYLRAL